MQKNITKEDTNKTLKIVEAVGVAAVWNVADAMNKITKEVVLKDGRIVDFNGYLKELINVVKG